jgi:hypothetical protein
LRQTSPPRRAAASTSISPANRLPDSPTWSYLTKSYGHERESGRKHPAFTEESVKRSITDGVDPAGHPLDTAMPRYSLSDSDLVDLVAYLKRLETDTDPGSHRDHDPARNDPADERVAELVALSQGAQAFG